MAAELAIIAKLQDEASSGIRSLRGEVEGLGTSGELASKGFASLQTVGTAALAALAAAAVAVGGAIVSSINVAADFESQIAILSTAAGDAGTSLDTLRGAAMAVGADVSLVGVSASGAADAMTILYKAGLSTGEIFGDLNGYLAGNAELSGALRAAIDGAAASELDMAQAAELAATTLATFGGSMTTTEERAQFVNDALNNFVQTADASVASVADLAAAMQTIGPTAAQFGFSLQDTNTALALLSTRGIAGSEAGTALKSMFVNLMRPTADVKGALAELNVSLYNTDGTMRSMPQIIGDLSQALYGMNEVTTVAGGRTAEQNHQLELAQKSYNQATDAIYKHNAGLKVLTDSQLQKYVEQQSAANAEIQRLSAVTGTASTAVAQLTEEQRNQYITTLAGSYGMKAMAVLLMEGTAGWEAMEKAISEAATIQEVAAARTQTFSGAMEALQGVIETIQIGIGSAFLPVLTALAKALAQLASENMQEIVSAFEAVGNALAFFFDAILAGTHPVTAFADAVGQLAEALGMPAEQAALLRDQIEGVLMAIGSIVGPIVQAITSFVSWKDVLAAVGIAIASVVIPALIGLVQVFAPIIATIAAVILAVAALRNAWESDFLGIRSAVEGAVEIFGRFVEAIRVLTDENARIQAMVDALAKLPEPLQLLAAAVASFINTLRDGGSLVDAFRAGLETLKQAIFDWAGTTNWGEIGGIILDKIAAAFSSLGDRVATTAAGILNWITTSVNSIDWNAVGTAIVNGIAAAITGVVGLLVAGGTAIVNFFSGFFTNDSLQTAGTSLVTALGNAISGAAAGIASGLESIKQAIFDWAGADSWGEVGSAIIDKIAETFRNLGDKVAEVEAGIFNWISEAINGIDWREVGESIINGIVAAITAVVGLLVSAGTAIVNYFVGFFTNDEIAPAAQNLITSLGNAIGEFAGGIVDGLAKVRDAIFNWAGVEDWSGVANKIVEMIGLKLGEAKDAIAAKLGEWQTAIFDWAGTEDWQGVADHIADLIGEKLGEAGEVIAGQLSEWQTAIFDWAGAEDWTGVATHIAELVGSALADAATNLWDGLESWEQAIFDWVGATSWIEVGIAIAEAVGQALADGVTAISEKLGEWEQAIFDWAGAANWIEVGQTIVEMAVEGLTEWASAAADKVEDWFGAVSDTISGIDWYQIGYDISHFVVSGLIEFGTAVSEKITGWYTSIKTFVEGKTWDQIALLIIGAIALGLGKFATEAETAVSTWKTEISAKITAMIGAFSELGGNIVAGIISGITAMANAVGEAIRGVIAGALGAGEDEAGSHSPATRFMPLGSDITAGVAVGITSNASMALEAIRNVASQIELEGVKAFGEAMQAIAAGVAAALSAILDIGSFQGAGDGFGAAMQALVDMMAAMVAAVAAANTYTAEVLENLGTFVEAAEAINDLLVQTADVVDYIGRWRAPDIASVNSSIETLVGFLAQMVQGIIGLNLEAMLILGELGNFLDSAAELPALFMGVADIASYLAGWQAPSLAPVIVNVQQLAALLGTLVTAVAGANTMGLGMLDILAAFIETAADIVALIAPLADAILDIANFPAGAELAIMQANIERMAGYLAQIVTAVAGANTMGLLSLEQLSAFVEVAADIVALINPMAEAMYGIANFPQGTDVQVMARNIELMAGYLRDLVAAIAESNSWGQLTLELLDTFVQVAGSIAELITPLAEAIWNIANFQPPDLFAFVGNIATLAGHLGTMVVWFYSSLNLSQAALEALGQYIDVMSSIAEGIVSFTDAIAAIAAFEPPDLFTFVGNIATLAGHLGTMVVWFYNGLNLSQAALEALGQYIEVMSSIAEGMVSFIDAIAAIANFQPPDLFTFIGNVATLAGHLATMVVWFYNGLNLSMAALEALGQYVEVIGDLVDLIADAIEALGLIAAYSGDTAALGPAIAAFAADLMLLVQTLAAGFVSASAASLEAIVAAGEFADAMGDILEVVEDGVEALAALASYIPSTDLASTTQRFAADLALVINTIVAALQQAGVLANAAVTAAGEMAGALEDIVGVVGPAVEAIVYLVGYVQVGGLQAAAQQFAADLVIVITTLADGFRSAGLATNQAVLEAGEMAGNLDDLLSVVEPALHADKGAITLIAKYVSDANLVAKAQQFTADLLMVAQTLVDGLTQSTLAIGVALAKAGEMGKSLKDLFDAIEPALGAVEDIAAYTSTANLTQKAQQFTADLVALATIIVTGLSTAANQLGAPAIEAASDFAIAANAIVASVAAAFTSLTELADIPATSGLGEKVTGFTQQLVGATLAMATALATATQTIGTEALASATEFAAAVASLLDSVGTALAALAEIGEIVLAAGLVGKVQAFGQQLIAIATFLAQGLSAAAAQLGTTAIAAAVEFSASANQILEAVDAALRTMTDIGENELATGLGAKIQSFAQQLIAITLFLAQGLSGAATQLGATALTDAVQFANSAAAVAQAVDSALRAITAIAENNLADGVAAKIQALGQQLVAIATFLATSLAAAAQTIGGATVAAATQFATSVAALAAEVQAAMTALGQLAGMAAPNIQPILAYIVASAQQILVAFSSAGDIGAAVTYAENFRANLQQLVTEIQQAVALLNQIAGTGTSGSIQAALNAIAASLQNATGQFTGAGQALANALITALAGGINSGQGQVMGAASYMLEATRAAGENVARNFDSVGNSITDAIASSVQSGQGQVIAAVTQVINAAIAAGVAAARAAASVGQQLVQAALTEVNNGRGALDTAGGAAGNALIDGMARAITNGKSRVVSAIIATINAAISAAKAALGIASPSKVAIDLLSNFMNTAARTVEGLRGRLADSMATAVSGAAAAAATGLNGVRLTPATAPAFGTPALSDSLGERAAFAAVGRGKAAEYGSGANHTQVVFYGNVVLPNVTDSRSFLEELDALRGGA